jgi:hypothetical protein
MITSKGKRLHLLRDESTFPDMVKNVKMKHWLFQKRQKAQPICLLKATFLWYKYPQNKFDY